MALPKAIKLMLSAIGSAGMLLGLSGGVFAADGGQGTTPQDTTGSVIQQSNKDSVVVQDSQSDSTVAVNGKSSNGGQGGSASQEPPVASNNNSASSAAPASGAVTALTSGTKSGLLNSPPNNGSVTSSSPEPAQIVATTDVAGVPKGTSESSGLMQVAPMGQSVVYHSMRLAIGPKVTPMNSQAIDLASMIPTAPAQQQNPSIPFTPVIPSGLFSAFATKLASTVVPPVITVSNWGFTGLVTAIYILASLLVLTFGLAVSEFGSWTRRGGYAHAARSDVPSAIINTFFATPHRLGYVLAFAPLRSPIFMVSETKTVFLTVPNAYRKEEMR